MASKRLSEDTNSLLKSSKRVCLVKMESSNDINNRNCNELESSKDLYKQHLVCNLHEKTFGVQPTRYNIWCATYTKQHLVCNLHETTFGVQPTLKLLPREEELRKIHYLFELLDTKKSTLVLYGMSGVGKTDIAKKYCAVYNNFYTNIIWIDAAIGKLESSMKNLCQSLGLIIQDSKGDYFDIEIIIEKIHNHYKNEKTLYIFDNVDDESVKNIRMYISKKPNSFTLMTSQWRTWSDNVFQMSIDVFSPEEAFTYLKINITENNEEKIKELIKELGFHPFAITQAIKYMNKHEVSIETFINRYRLHPIEILDNEKFRTEEESNSTIKAINLVLTKLEKTEIIPLKILNFLSHCDGQNISKHFLTKISKYMKINEEYLIDDAILLLQNYSLLDRSGDGNYTMHELTQLSCKYYQKKNSSTNIYLNLIEKYLKFELNELKDHVDYGNHFVLHFLYLFCTNKIRMSKVFYRSADKINSFLTCKGLYLETIEILNAIYSFNKKTYGENQELTLNTKNSFASCLYKMGKYKKALEIYYSVGKIQVKVLGRNHLSTMTTKNNIAICLFEMRNFSEALEIYYSVDQVKTEVLGINHPSTMITKNNIAMCLRKLGKYKEALEIHYSIDEIQTKILGINHPATMTNKNNIAICLNEMGKYIEALEIYYSIDELQTESLGFSHSSTTATKNNIASCLLEMGKCNEALEIYYSVDKIQTEIHPNPNNPSTRATKINIAHCLYKMGKYNEAFEFYSVFDKMETEVSGDNKSSFINGNHASLMATKNNTANCLYEMRKYEMS